MDPVLGAVRDLPAPAVPPGSLGAEKPDRYPWKFVWIQSPAQPRRDLLSRRAVH